MDVNKDGSLSEDGKFCYLNLNQIPNIIIFEANKVKF